MGPTTVDIDYVSYLQGETKKKCQLKLLFNFANIQTIVIIHRIEIVCWTIWWRDMCRMIIDIYIGIIARYCILGTVWYI